MRLSPMLHLIVAPALLLAVACADSPTAPGPSGALPSTPALSGGSTSSGGGGGGGTTATAKVAGQWAGAFQTVLQYDSKAAMSLSVAGSVVTGTITFTYNYVPGQLQSAVTGSWDGTTLTLHFSAPNGDGTVVAVPSFGGRYGTAFVALVKSSADASITLGTLNIGKI